MKVHDETTRLTILMSLLLPAFLLGLGRGFIIPVLPVIARDEFMVGAVAATVLFMLPLMGMLLSTLPSGYLIDHLGRRKVLIIGPALTAVSTLLAFWSVTFWQLAICLMVNGIALQLWEMGRIASIVDSQQISKRGKLITSLAGLQRAGTLLGPLAGGLIGTLIDLRLPFLLYTLAALVCTVLMLIYAVETSVAHRKDAASGLSAVKATTIEQKQIFWRQIRQPQVLALLVVQVSSSLARGGTWSTSGPAFVYAAFAYNLAASELGVISLLVGLLTLPATVVAGFIMDRHGRKICFVPASVSMGLGLLGMALVAWQGWSLYLFLATYVWASLASAFMSGAMQTIAADLAPEAARGRFISITRLMANAGEVGSPGVFALTVALIASPGGYAVGFMIMGLCGLFTAGITSRLVGETLQPGPSHHGGEK